MMGFFRRNYLWMFLTALSSFATFLLGFLNPVNTIKFSAYFGIFFLCLTLLPINILRWMPSPVKEWLTWLVKYRRGFGITAGMLFCLHGLLAIEMLGGWNTTFLLSSAILPGLVAVSVFIVMLLTSSLFVQRVLQRSWKLIHSWVWFAVPFALIHSMLALQKFEGGVSIVGLTSFGGLILFVIIEFLLHERARVPGTPPNPLRWKHLRLAIGGLLAAMAVFLLYPERPAPAGVPTNSPEESAVPATNLPIISETELRQHNRAEDCYIAYKGQVYDLTSFISQHPGGQAILAQCGRVTDEFGQQHSGGSFDSPQVQQVLRTLLIGQLAE